jgi:hypothetical protein
MTEEKLSLPLIWAFDDPSNPEPLHPDLAEHLYEESFGPALKHPLVFSVPHFSVLNKHMNLMFEQKKKSLKEAISESAWHRFVFLHERPYRINALEEVLFTHEVDDPEVIWPLIGHSWTDSDNINQCLSQWIGIWDIGAGGREKVMDDAERDALAAMPDTLTIYRGVGHVDAVAGLSWTTSVDTAIWFAKRYEHGDRTPMVSTGKVQKSDVLAHFLGRSENEIVVLPDAVSNIEVVNL